MRFRFTLTDPIGGTKIISEPSGWDTSALRLERHPQLLSIVEYFKSSFQTYGSNGTEDGGRDWILAVEKLYGPDALIGCKVEMDPDDSLVYRTIYNGVLGVGQFIETLDQDHLLQIVFGNSDFWSKIMSRWDTQVDLRSTVDLDGNAIVATPKFTLPLPSQVIVKSYLGMKQLNSVIPYEFNSSPGPSLPRRYFIFAFDKEDLKEIEAESSLVPTAVDDLVSVVPFFNVDSDGTLDINQIKFCVSFGDTRTDANIPGGIADFNAATNDKTADISTLMDVFIQKNNEIPISFSKATRTIAGSFLRNDGITVTNQGTTITDYILSNQQLVLKKYDAIRIYGHISSPTWAGDVFVWGSNGWGHDSGYDQVRSGQGSTISADSGFTETDNKGSLSWGGYYDASVNIFPTTIDTNPFIEAGNWWNVANDGNLGGTIVSSKNIITAKIDHPTNSIADWDITTLTIYEGLEAYGAGSIMDLTFQTTAPATTTEALHTHDVVAGVLDRISGRTGLFYSEYLGHPWTSRVYPSIGCGSLKSNMKGLHIRGYSLVDKPFSSSMKDWWDGINPIDCLGMGYEKLSGDDIVRCEPPKYFFNDSSMSVLFSNIQTIKRSYDPDWQFNSIDYGYNKWQSQAATGVGTPSGIDDPQSQGTRNTIFKIIGKKFKSLSTWLGASLALETMRRLGNLLSANYTYDDDICVICLYSNGDGTFTPELDENFSSITGLSNSHTRYNTSISSVRNFLRWVPYLSGCLQSYLTSFFKFVPGQGNYTMSTTKTTSCDGDETGIAIAENQDLPIGTDFLFLPNLFEIDHYMDLDDYQTLVANKNKAIGISQTTLGHKKAFIKSLDYTLVTGLVKLVVWAKEPFEIVVPDSFSSVEGTSIKYFEQPYHETQFE
jgi:hypothetical protein